MDIKPYIKNINSYLVCDGVIDFRNENITQLADTLYQKAENELDFIKTAYEFVRDHISHSADINEDELTHIASDVLKKGHGICFSKSHLLAAVLRSKSIPTGFCYQKLILDDETAPILIYHGLNGVYLREYNKWIRLDPRGNKKGVNAQFSIETEHLAFPVRPEMGETENFIVYPDPDIYVLNTLRENRTRTELWNNLPTKLRYEESSDRI
ncbi:MAG: transglutaminase-like domain-containing protein [Clostridiales bacterium]|nr:transglutaminase-like domain-containing protein [Clostridiales bacterium]